MLTLKRLKVRGFRGFRGDEEFDFDQPATLLFGGNHCGKSSTLNAVEWALFGDECKGTQTGIRERVGWEIANRHMQAPDVLAEVELEGPGGPYVVRRTLEKSGRKSATERLELALADGKMLTGDVAGQRLGQLLGSSFRDFMTTVYQHQEAIRAVLTQEPRERNDAIDRLLGLADYRNLLDAIKDANPRKWHKQIHNKFQVFEGEVRTALASRENDLNESRQRAAAKADIPENKLNENTALGIAVKVRQALATFANEAGIGVVAAEVPRTWKHLEPFEEATRTEMNRLRGELPDLEEQQKLFGRRIDAANLKSEIENAKGLSDEIGRSIRELDVQHGDQLAVSARIPKVRKDLDECDGRLRETSARAKLISEAIDYLEKTNVKELTGRCPVCEGPAPNLLRTLSHQWQESLDATVAALKEKIKSLQAELGALEQAADTYNKWNQKLTGHATNLIEYREKASKLLEQPLTDRDDPLALLSAELNRIDRRLEEVKRAVQDKQDRLDSIGHKLEMMREIREILQLEEKKKIIERIKESPEYEKLEALRDRAAELVADVEGIKDAVTAASHEEARDKLGAAEATIDCYFRRLTQHPAVTRFGLAVSPDTRTGRNSYDLTDQDGKDLTPVLSQGDLNALALAMLLGLACSAEGTGAFGFVMLDDPSQSLGSEHKEQLVGVLNEVADSKKLVLATMDREFRDCWREGLGKAKTEYLFEEWTPEQGPSITRK
jgi:exonuclease SbcC